MVALELRLISFYEFVGVFFASFHCEHIDNIFALGLGKVKKRGHECTLTSFTSVDTHEPLLATDHKAYLQDLAGVAQHNSTF